jgi:hypothetical protein
VGQWFLLEGEWRRVVKVGKRFATMIGKRGRRYIPLADLVDLKPTDWDGPPAQTPPT